jgi:Ni,Fe-hydrogenase I large subunit
MVLDEAPALGASDVRPLPEANAADLVSAVLAALDGDPAFARAPRWRGAAAETGALARCASHAGIAAFVERHGHGVAARLLARCVDLARTVASLADGRVEPRVIAWSPSDGEGVAAVHAARGLLVHRSRVADGRVVEHAIVAPTEWNFHPDGALARGVAGLAADDEARLVRDAMLVAQSLDPCVACIVEVAHA